MNVNETVDDVKTEVATRLAKLATLRDEARLHLHLATLDAKQEWSDKLEPRIDELQRTAHQLTDGSRTAIQELLGTVEGFVARLRPGRSDGAKKDLAS